MEQATHPTIKKFWSERAFHERLGIVIDPRPLGERPWREVREYELMFQAEAQASKEKSKR
jgi:hypothetical protein